MFHRLGLVLHRVGHLAREVAQLAQPGCLQRDPESAGGQRAGQEGNVTA
jgi:hypothetical protein